jgi:hypothetical protein
MDVPPGLDTCAHCGRRLPAESVCLALEAIGTEYIPPGTQLFCPRYNPQEETCPEEPDAADAELPAFWRFT